MSVLQLLAELPFNPGSSHRLADYRRQLKGDEWWRQTGLLLLAANLVVLTVAASYVNCVWVTGGAIFFGLMTLCGLGLWLRDRLILKELKIISHE